VISAESQALVVSSKVESGVRTSKNIKSNTTLHNLLHVTGDGFRSCVFSS
jgi:hypothetical protein